MASTPDEATRAVTADPAPAGPPADTPTGPSASASLSSPPRSAEARDPRGGPTTRSARRAPLALAASVTTAWAALVSLAPVVGVVLLSHFVSGADAPVSRVLRVGLAGWLLAHGVELRAGAGWLGLAPLAFTVVAAWRVARAGVHTTRAIGGRRRGSPRLALSAAGAVAAIYGVLGAGAAALARMPGLDVSPRRAGLTLATFGFVAALGGALIETGTHARLARRTPMPVRDATRTGLVAALLVLGAGAASAGTALAFSGGAAAKVLAAYHAGVAGQVGITLVCVVYGPNFAVWAASYLVGPGFALGAGTVVSAARVSLGTVPALPVLAGVPARPASGWAGLLLVVPMAAGMAAGWLLARRRLRVAGGAPDGARTPPVGWLPLLAAAALSGPVAGVALALAAWASAGPLGAGHLSQVGPHPWPLGGIAAALVAAGAVVAAAATKILIGSRRRDA